MTAKKQVKISYIDRMKFLSNHEIRQILIEGGIDISKGVKKEERFDTLDLIFTGEPLT